MHERPSNMQLLGVLVAGLMFLVPAMMSQVAPVDSFILFGLFILIVISINAVFDKADAVVPQCNFGYFFRYHASPRDLRTVSAVKRGSSLSRPKITLFSLVLTLFLLASFASANGVTLLSPIDITNTTDSNITVIFNVNQTDNCTINLDGVPQVTASATDNSTYVLNHSAEGLHNWSVNCTHIGSSSVENFTIDEYSITSYIEANQSLYDISENVSLAGEPIWWNATFTNRTYLKTCNTRDNETHTDEIIGHSMDVNVTGLTIYSDPAAELRLIGLNGEEIKSFDVFDYGLGAGNAWALVSYIVYDDIDVDGCYAATLYYNNNTPVAVTSWGGDFIDQFDDFDDNNLTNDDGIRIVWNETNGNVYHFGGFHAENGYAVMETGAEGYGQCVATARDSFGANFLMVADMHNYSSNTNNGPGVHVPLGYRRVLRPSGVGSGYYADISGGSGGSSSRITDGWNTITMRRVKSTTGFSGGYIQGDFIANRSNYINFGNSGSACLFRTNAETRENIYIDNYIVYYVKDSTTILEKVYSYGNESSFEQTSIYPFSSRVESTQSDEDEIYIQLEILNRTSSAVIATAFENWTDCTTIDNDTLIKTYGMWENQTLDAGYYTAVGRVYSCYTNETLEIGSLNVTYDFNVTYLTLNSPDNTTTNTTTNDIGLYFTVGLNDTCSVYVNGGLNNTDSAVGGVAYEHILSNLEDAEYTWYVNCVGAGVSETRTFTVNEYDFAIDIKTDGDLYSPGETIALMHSSSQINSTQSDVDSFVLYMTVKNATGDIVNETYVNWALSHDLSSTISPFNLTDYWGNVTIPGEWNEQNFSATVELRDEVNRTIYNDSYAFTVSGEFILFAPMNNTVNTTDNNITFSVQSPANQDCDLVLTGVNFNYILRKSLVQGNNTVYAKVLDDTYNWTVNNCTITDSIYQNVNLTVNEYAFNFYVNPLETSYTGGETLGITDPPAGWSQQHSSWSNRINLSIEEPLSTVSFTDYMIRTNVTDLTLTHNCTQELRAVFDGNGSNVTIQTIIDGSSESQGSQWCEVIFYVNRTDGNNQSVMFYHNNPIAPVPVYPARINATSYLSGQAVDIDDLAAEYSDWIYQTLHFYLDGGEVAAYIDGASHEMIWRNGEPGGDYYAGMTIQGRDASGNWVGEMPYTGSERDLINGPGGTLVNVTCTWTGGPLAMYAECVDHTFGSNKEYIMTDYVQYMTYKNFGNVSNGYRFMQQHKDGQTSYGQCNGVNWTSCITGTCSDQCLDVNWFAQRAGPWIYANAWTPLANRTPIGIRTSDWNAYWGSAPDCSNGAYLINDTIDLQWNWYLHNAVGLETHKAIELEEVTISSPMIAVLGTDETQTPIDSQSRIDNTQSDDDLMAFRMFIAPVADASNELYVGYENWTYMNISLSSSPIKLDQYWNNWTIDLPDGDYTLWMVVYNDLNISYGSSMNTSSNFTVSNQVLLVSPIGIVTDTQNITVVFNTTVTQNCTVNLDNNPLVTAIAAQGLNEYNVGVLSEDTDYNWSVNCTYANSTTADFTVNEYELTASIQTLEYYYDFNDTIGITDPPEIGGDDDLIHGNNTVTLFNFMEGAAPECGPTVIAPDGNNLMMNNSCFDILFTDDNNPQTIIIFNKNQNITGPMDITPERLWEVNDSHEFEYDIKDFFHSQHEVNLTWNETCVIYTSDRLPGDLGGLNGNFTWGLCLNNHKIKNLMEVFNASWQMSDEQGTLQYDMEYQFSKGEFDYKFDHDNNSYLSVSSGDLIEYNPPIINGIPCIECAHNLSIGDADKKKILVSNFIKRGTQFNSTIIYDPIYVTLGPNAAINVTVDPETFVGFDHGNNSISFLNDGLQNVTINNMTAIGGDSFFFIGHNEGFPITIEANDTLNFTYEYDFLPTTIGKYNVSIGITLENGTDYIVLIDPFWNSTWRYGKEVQINSTCVANETDVFINNLLIDDIYIYNNATKELRLRSGECNTLNGDFVNFTINSTDYQYRARISFIVPSIESNENLSWCVYYLNITEVDNPNYTIGSGMELACIDTYVHSDYVSHESRIDSLQNDTDCIYQKMWIEHTVNGTDVYTGYENWTGMDISDGSSPMKLDAYWVNWTNQPYTNGSFTIWVEAFSCFDNSSVVNSSFSYQIASILRLVSPYDGILNTTGNEPVFRVQSSVPGAGCSLYINDVVNKTGFAIGSGFTDITGAGKFSDGAYNWTVNCTSGLDTEQVFDFTIDEYSVTGQVNTIASSYRPLESINITDSSNITNLQGDSDDMYIYMWIRNSTANGTEYVAHEDWGTTYPISGVYQLNQIFNDWIPSYDLTTSDFYVEVEVYTNNNDSLLNFMSSAFHIQNSAPVVDNITVQPVSGYFDTQFTCENGSATDADSDAVTLNYTWYLNGTPIAEYGKNLTLGTYNHSDLISCLVHPNDGYVNGTGVFSINLTVSDYAPVFGAYSNITWNETELYYDFNCTDAESDPLVWSDNATEFAIASGGIVNWTPDDIDVGDHTFLITCDDGYGGDASASWNVTIENIPEAPEFDEDLSNHSMNDREDWILDVNCTDPDPTGDTVTYTWNFTHGTINSSSGEIEWLYVSDDHIGNHTINITCSDGVLSNSQIIILEINNTAPVIESIAVSPTPTTAVDDLMCNESYTNDTVSAVYSWYKNNAVQTYTTRNIHYSATNNGENWSCCVVVDDQWSASSNNCSANVTIAGNNAPSTPTLLVPLNGTGTSCSTYFDWTTSVDPDGDNVTYEVIVDNNVNFLSPEISFSGLVASTYTYGACLGDDMYYWKVRSQDDQNQTSSWATSWEFYVGPSCYDGIMNGDETGVDCGGSCPAACAENVTTYADHCTDGIRNYWESDVDCGGSALFHDVCPPCGLGQRCVNQYKYESALVEYAEHDNCDRNVGLWCDDSTMRCSEAIPAQCSNKVLNTEIGETDIDCGGDCGPCDLGQRCGKDHENCESNVYCDTRTKRCVTLPDGYNRGYSAEQGTIGSGKLEYSCPSHPHEGTKDLDESDLALDCGGNTLMHIIDFGERVLTDNFDAMWPEGSGILHGFAVYSENGSIIYSNIPTVANTSTADMESNRFYCVNVPLCDGNTYYYRYVVIDNTHAPPYIIYDSDTDLGGQTATKWGPARHYIVSDSSKAKQGVVHHDSIFVEDMPNATKDLYAELIDACNTPDGETLIILNGSTAWPSSTCNGQRAWIVARLARHEGMKKDNPDYDKMIFRSEVADKWGEFYGVNPEGDVVGTNNLFYNYKIRMLGGEGDDCSEKTESGPIIEEKEQNDRRIGCMIIPMCKDSGGISVEYQLVASTPHTAPFRKVLYSSKWVDSQFELNGLYTGNYTDSCHYPGYVIPSTDQLNWQTSGDSNIRTVNVFGNVPIPSQMPDHNVTNDSVLTLYGNCNGSEGVRTSMQIYTDSEYFTDDFLRDRIIVGYEASLYELAPSSIIKSIPEPFFRSRDGIDRVGSFGLMLNSQTPLHRIDIKNLCKGGEYAVYLRYFTPVTNKTISLPVSLDIIKDDTGGSLLGYAIDFDYAPVGFFWIQTPHPIVTRFTSVKVGQTMVLGPGEFLDYNVKELLTPPKDVGVKARLPWVGQTGEVDSWIKNLIWFVNPKNALGDMANELYKIWLGPFFSPEDWKGIAGCFKATMAVFIITLLRFLVLAIFTSLVYRLWTRILGNLDIWMIFGILFLVFIIILKTITYDTFISIITLGFK